MTEILSDTQTRALHALCDTVVPSTQRPDDTDRFWARRVTDVGADRAVLLLFGEMPAEQRGRLGALLGVIGAQGFRTASQESREQILTTLSRASAPASPRWSFWSCSRRTSSRTRPGATRAGSGWVIRGRSHRLAGNVIIESAARAGGRLGC